MFTPDRRRLPRLPTTIVVESLDDGGWMVAHDISLGGMMVTTRKLRWPGEHVRVRFSLPGERRAIRATCRVVELAEVPHGSGLALSFLRLHPEAQLALHRCVDGRPPESPERDSIASRVKGWVHRMVEDCAQLGALARI